MPKSNTVFIFCYVNDDCKPICQQLFDLKIAPNAFVGWNLIKAIRNQLENNQITTYNPAQIVLWKLTPPIDSIDLLACKTEIQTFHLDLETYTEQHGKAVRLNPLSRLSEYFGEHDLKDDHVHVLVQLSDRPDEGLQRRWEPSADAYDQDYHLDVEEAWSLFGGPPGYPVLVRSFEEFIDRRRLVRSIGS